MGREIITCSDKVSEASRFDLTSKNNKSFLNKVLINGNLLSSLIKKMHLLHKDKIIDTRCLGLMAGVEFKNNQMALGQLYSPEIETFAYGKSDNIISK